MAKAKKPTEPKPIQITKEDFTKGAKPMQVTIGSTTITLSPKDFSTGSFGWFAGEKVVVEVEGKPIKCQLGLNLIVVGSKPE